MKKHLILLFLALLSVSTIFAQDFKPIPSQPEFPGISAPSSDIGNEILGAKSSSKKKSNFGFSFSGYGGFQSIGGSTGLCADFDVRLDIFGVELVGSASIGTSDSSFTVGGGMGYRFINNDKFSVSASLLAGYVEYQMSEEEAEKKGWKRNVYYEKKDRINMLYRPGEHSDMLLAVNIHANYKLNPHLALSADLTAGPGMIVGYFTFMPKIGCTVYF